MLVSYVVTQYNPHRIIREDALGDVVLQSVEGELADELFFVETD